MKASLSAAEEFSHSLMTTLLARDANIYVFCPQQRLIPATTFFFLTNGGKSNSMCLGKFIMEKKPHKPNGCNCILRKTINKTKHICTCLWVLIDEISNTNKYVLG
jgi:hypothetical protein